MCFVLYFRLDMKPQISYLDFAKLDLRVGKIKKAQILAGSDKLMKLTVDMGEEVGLRTILAGIKPFYTTKTLLNKEIIVLVNLEPKKMMGEESQGMLLATDGIPALLKPSKKVAAGTVIR